ncbi:unnamed protein product [Arctogadus glacialis]
MGGSSLIVVKTFLPAGGLPSSLVWFPALDPRPKTRGPARYHRPGDQPGVSWFPALDPRPKTRGPARCELVPCPGSQTTDQGTSPV